METPVYAANAIVLVFALALTIGGAATLNRNHDKTLPVEFAAAKSGSLDRLERAVRSGFSVNDRSPDGVTCLQV